MSWESYNTQGIFPIPLGISRLLRRATDDTPTTPCCPHSRDKVDPTPNDWGSVRRQKKSFGGHRTRVLADTDQLKAQGL